MTTLNTLLTRIREDLGDTDTKAYKWLQAEIERHIEKAVGEFSNVYPVFQKTICFIQKEVHKVDDDDNEVTSADPTDTSTANTVLTEAKGDVNTHIASTTYHRAADTTNTISADDATDEASGITLATELIADINGHFTEDGVHMVDDEANTITAAIPVDETTLVEAAKKIKAGWNNHLDEETDGRTLYVGGVVATTGFLRFEAVEYPAGQFPPRKPEFDYYTGNFLKIKTGPEPGETGELVYVYWHKRHTLSSTTSTIPLQYEELICLGAGGHALISEGQNQRVEAETASTEAKTAETEAASYEAAGQSYLETGDDTIDTLTDGDNVPSEYRAYAQAEFAKAADARGRSAAAMSRAGAFQTLSDRYFRDGRDKIEEFRTELKRLARGSQKPFNITLRIWA